MNNKPIGIFDSGLGGLTVMAEVIKLLPHEDIIYFGDTARVPYGSKSQEVVEIFSMQIAEFLKKKKVKLIVVACNTASAFALNHLRNKLDIPVIGVIDPGAKTAVSTTKNRRIGIIGTHGTIKSKSYEKAINKIDNKNAIYSQSCPLFVPLVEEGWLNGKITEEIAKKYLKNFKTNKIDTLILGCTHYPLLKNTIAGIVGKGVKLVDSARSTAIETVEALGEYNFENCKKTNGSYQFYVSDSPEKFEKIGRMFLGKKLCKVIKINIEG
jgi:glutamate racemase